MEVFQICGGTLLSGEVTVSGAKNAVLPILAGCCLCRGVCVLHNCPDIADVHVTLAILRALGAAAHRSGGTLVVDTTAMTQSAVPAALAAKMRSSVLFAGALLASCGEAELPLPGGCPLGARPIDLHLAALKALGAACREADGVLNLHWARQTPAEINFPIPSVGATENAMLAALACPGETVLKNAAMEPEIVDFANFLRSAGAEICGAGGREIHIWGQKPLHGTTYTILPDRIETATFLCAVAGCGGDALLRRTRAGGENALVRTLRRAGCEIVPERDALHVRKAAALRPVTKVKTAPWPGFPTDCQALLMAALLRAEGQSRIEEAIFETRFHHLPELQKLGADIELQENTASVRGVPRLYGAHLTARDLRGGAALVLAALQAEGESTVAGLSHIDRGYEQLEGKLRALGAHIHRTPAG